MPDNHIDLLWKRHDSLTEAVNGVKEAHGITQARMDRIERDFQQMQSDNNQHHGEMMAVLSEVKGSIRELFQSQSYSQGSKDAKKWLVPVSISALTLAVGALSVLIMIRG